MATQVEVIQKFMKSLDTHTFNLSNVSGDQVTTTKFTTKILDAAVNYATSGTSRHFSTTTRQAGRADISAQSQKLSLP